MNFGRVVIPLETRQKLGIKEGDTLAIDIEDMKITLEKVDK